MIRHQMIKELLELIIGHNHIQEAFFLKSVHQIQKKLHAVEGTPLIKENEQI